MGWISVFAGCAGAAILALAPAAHADLKAYNAAVTRGDFAAASNEIAVTWAGLDRARDDIFVIGREFGWTAMLADKPVLARDVVGSLSGSKVVDPSPELTAVLLAWANFKVSGSAANRTKLFDALRARVTKPQRDLISVKASQDLFHSEWKRDAMNSAAEAASLGHKVVAELGPEMADLQFTMRRFETISRFVQSPSRKDYVDISGLVDEIDVKLKAERNPAMRGRLITELAHALAWAGVERNVLERRGLSVPAGQVGEAGKDWFTTLGDPSVPVCDIGVDQNKTPLKYPRMAESKGLPGYAIYAFGMGEGGKLTSAKVLGSAPHESFTETIDQIQPSWRWKVKEGSPADCRMPQQFLVHFVFEMKPG